MSKDIGSLAAAPLVGTARGRALRDCMDGFREDYRSERVVRIDSDLDRHGSVRLLTSKWVDLDVQDRLLEQEALLLRKVTALPGGGRLVGVYGNGDLAIRQRDSEIVQAVARKAREAVFGLYPYAVHGYGFVRGNADQLLKTIEAAGYYVPARPSGSHKTGLVAASESSDDFYVASPDKKKWRNALLKSDEASPSWVVFMPSTSRYENRTYISDEPYYDNGYFGAILWARG